MSDLIEREALVNAVASWSRAHAHGKTYRQGIADAIRCIDSAPSAGPKPLTAIQKRYAERRALLSAGDKAEAPSDE